MPSGGGIHSISSQRKSTDRLIELTADVVSAYVSNNPVPVAELPGLISRVYTSLLQQTDRLIKTVPEVESVFGKAGRADTATDPADRFAQERIAAMHEQIELLTDWYAEMERLDTERLLQLLRLGERVVKALEFKDRMLGRGKPRGDGEDKS